jgi:uncharacterized protein YegL
MKKILASFFILIFSSFASNTQAACTAQLQAATYGITDANLVYTEGDTIKTALSFKFSDKISINTQKPLRVVLVMDRSGSMGYEKGQKLAEAKKALIAAVNKVKAGALGSQVALVSYATSVTIDSYFTNNFDGVITQINNLKAVGSTAIGGGLAMAGAGYPVGNGVMGSLNPDPAYNRVIILASDGLENQYPSIAQAVDYVPADVTVYSIGIGGDVDDDKMEKVKNSGNKKGKKYAVDKVTDLTSVLEEIVTIEQAAGADTLQVTLNRPNDSAVEITNALGGVIAGNKNSVTWNFDNVTSDQTFSLPLEFLAKQAGSKIILNNAALSFSYTRGGVNCNSTANVLAQEVNVSAAPSNYSCSQEIFVCAVNQACNYTQNSTPVCIKTTPIKNLTEYLDAAVCEANGANCGTVVKTICNDNCGRNMGNWKEIAPY